MEYDLDGMDVLFVAGFGPITQSTPASREFYVAALGLPLKPMPGNEEYLLTEHDAIGGVKHFALWPLAQAARSCFDADLWPDYRRCRRRGSSLKCAISTPPQTR